MTLDEFFLGYKKSRQLFEAVYRIVQAIGPITVHVTKSQIAFRRRRALAWVWIPAKYLRGPSAPLVLTLAFRSRDRSPRWKEVSEPRPGRFTHHLELRFVKEIDAQVRQWLREAWLMAG
jgi:hypothetical protein